MNRKVIIKSGNMFTNEVDWDETITTVMDETGREEDFLSRIQGKRRQAGCHQRGSPDKVSRCAAKVDLIEST